MDPIPSLYLITPFLTSSLSKMYSSPSKNHSNIANFKLVKKAAPTKPGTVLKATLLKRGSNQGKKGTIKLSISSGLANS